MRRKGVSREEIIKLDEEASAPAIDKLLNTATKVAKFIGAEGITEQFGSDIARLGTKAGTTERTAIDQSFPSQKKVVGSALQTGALFVPGGQATLPGRIVAGAAAGYATDVGSKLQAGRTTEEALKPGLGTVVGGGIPVLGATASLFKKATQNLPNRIVQSALGQSKAQLMAGKDVSEYALRNRIVGTTDSLLRGSQSAIDDISTQINTALSKGAPKTVRILKNEVLSEVVDSINKSGGATNAAEIREIVDNLAPQARALLNKSTLSLPEANQLRQMIDKTLGDRAFLGAQLPYNKEILKGFNSVLREKVKSLAPSGTREMFGILSKEITLRDALLNKAAQQAKNQVVNAFDLILAGGGFLGGGPAGALGAFAVKKASQSTIGKTGVGVGLKIAQDQLNKLGPILSKLTPVERGIILSIIGSAKANQQETEALTE